MYIYAWVNKMYICVWCVFTSVQIYICKYMCIYVVTFHGNLGGFGITLENRWASL